MALLRPLVHGDLTSRRRDVELLWESANLLAWSRYALARMRRAPKLAATGQHSADTFPVKGLP